MALPLHPQPLSSAPEAFTRSLRAFDSDLIARWGPYVGCWIIERTCFVSPSLLKELKRIYLFANAVVEPTESDQKLAEEYLSGQRGAKIVCYAAKLDQRVFNALATSDVVRHGGMKYYLKTIDDNNARNEAAHQRQLASAIRDAAKEIRDKAEFISRKKINELYAGRSVRDMLTSGRSHGDATGWRLIDRRAVQPLEGEVR